MVSRADASGDTSAGDTLLCVANYPSNTGYAWDFIESLYRGVSERLLPHGVRTLVAYPRLNGAPATLEGSPARGIELDFRLDDWRALRASLQFVRAASVRVLYLTDRPVWDVRYPLLRAAGVRRIVVHDHTSGSRNVSGHLRRVLKWLSRRTPLMMADEVIGVSEFVRARIVAVDLVPQQRVHRIWNSLESMERSNDAGAKLRAAFGIAADRAVVTCACRAVPEKGVGNLLRAFDAMLARWPADRPRPVLVYMGDGPALEAWRERRAAAVHAADIVLAGYRADATALSSGADLCVVPSLWEEAFGMAVLEPMAYGVPVIASRVGGIPEIIVDGVTGVLVPPADEEALSVALERLLRDPVERERLGAAGRARARSTFSREHAMDQLLAVLVPGLPREPAGREGNLTAAAGT